jgi:hypothetical protein
MSDRKNKARYGDFSGESTWSEAMFPEVNNWLQEDRSRTTVLYSQRPHLLTAILGPRHQVWTGGSDNFRYKIWRVDAEGLPVWVLCSKRGTSYSVEHQGNIYDGTMPADVSDRLLRLLARLYVQMEELEPLNFCAATVAGGGDPLLLEARLNIEAQKTSGSGGERRYP